MACLAMFLRSVFTTKKKRLIIFLKVKKNTYNTFLETLGRCLFLKKKNTLKVFGYSKNIYSFILKCLFIFP